MLTFVDFQQKQRKENMRLSWICSVGFLVILNLGEICGQESGKNDTLYAQRNLADCFSILVVE